MKILTEEQETILQEERRYLNNLCEELVRLGVSQEDNYTLEQSIRQIDDLFLLVVVGEFNAGKSSFINALLGERYLEEGVTPTTTKVSIIRYGEKLTQSLLDENTNLITTPAEILRDISIVDTPGTNAIVREHEMITANFVPRSDMVLFVTSADRPFTESERLFLESIRNWGKKLLVVLNKCDIFNSDEERLQVEKFVTENIRSLLSIDPPIFSVSARMALQAKQGKPESWIPSRFESLENYIHDTLDAKSKIQLKFSNPLGVGLKFVQSYLEEIDSRLTLLVDDVEALGDIGGQLGVYQDDMMKDFQYRMSDIENIFFEMEKRGEEFFETTMRLEKIFDLMDKQFIQKEFQRVVVADVPHQVDEKIGDLIDWMVDHDFRQWEAVMKHLRERRQIYKERILGDSEETGFHYNRQRLIEAVGEEANRVVETYDKNKEAKLLAEGAQTAVAAAAVLEVGAVGLGTILAMITTTVAVDITGVLLAGALAVLGLFIIPARRRQARKDMSDKVALMRQRLVDTLKERFEVEIKQNLTRIQDAISPYRRFVQSEQSKLTEAKSSLTEVKNRLLSLQDQIKQF